MWYANLLENTQTANAQAIQLTETLPGNVLVGRQPIFTADLEIHAYELLFRDESNQSCANIQDGDLATSQLILNTFLEIGPETIVGDRPAFINLTRNFILDDHIMAIDKNRIVIEILEDVEVDQRLIERVRQLSSLGYQIALDDFIYDSKYEELIRYVDIIKIDILGMEVEQIRSEVEKLRPFYVKLLAEKIETQEEFELCKSLGIDYYQGFFLSRPTVVSGNRVPTNRLSVLNLMRLLYEQDVKIRKIEECIVNDVSLSYRLLKNINSSYFGLKTNIESVNHALVMLGIDHIRQWVTMIAMARLNDKPSVLLIDALVRARMCENLARAHLRDNPEAYFTAGLFSNLDALLDTEMSVLLESMPLADPIKAALLDRSGDIGKALLCAINYEQGDWTSVGNYPMDNTKISAAYLDAVGWADQTRETLVAGG